MCVISLIVFSDDYLGHVRTFYTNGFSLHSNHTNGFSLHSNYIQIHNNIDYPWGYKHLCVSQTIIFFVRFLLISAVKSLKKLWNEQKRLKNGWKKCFDQLTGAASTRKLFEIHNICFLWFLFCNWFQITWYSSSGFASQN